MGTVIYFIQIILILCAGIALGWWYCYKFVVKPLKAQNKALRKVDVEELKTHMGSVEIRTSEWPLNACEYLEHQADIENPCKLSKDQLAQHMNVFTAYITNRQKRDFIKICQQVKNGDKIEEIVKQIL